MCVGDIEHLLHLFFDCPYAQKCWQQVGLAYDMREVVSAPEWLLNRLSTESNDTLIKIATVLYAVWWARNKRIWDDKSLPSEVAMAWSSRQITDWRQAQTKRNQINKRLQTDKVQHTSRWLAPEPGTLKLNVDASVYEGADSFSIGIVVRNHQGLFVRGKVCRFAGCATVFEAELVGILEALKWSAVFNEQKIYVESDSLLSVQAIRNNMQNLLEEGLLIDQCRSILSSTLGLSLGFIKKHGNKVAHDLARLPCMLNSFIEFSSPPSCVLETLVMDV